MNNKHFCTCNDFDCKFNPHNHANGCDACIKKNLKAGEIPSCFFKAISEDLSDITKFTYEEFAQLVIDRKSASK